jgi:hypothetical protein
MFSLIMSGRYADALTFISTKSALKTASNLERAYCTWKTGKTAVALELLSNARSHGELHLKALLLMRMGEYEQAHTIYSDLVTGAKGDKQVVIELVRRMLPVIMQACGPGSDY